MNHRSLIVSTCCMLLYPGWGDLAIGQSNQCPVEDYRCLDQRFGAACMATPEGATAETCAAWLSELLDRTDVNAPEVQEILGHTYLLLATLSESPDARQSYRDLADVTFQGRSTEDPSDVRPLYGLSAAARTREQSAAHLRRAVAIDPTDLRAVEFLARVLLNMSGIPAVLESIEIQEYAYAEADLSNEMTRLRLASSLAFHYRNFIERLESALGTPESDEARIADAQARLTAFIERVRQDMAIDTKLMEIRQAPTEDSSLTVSYLSTLCHRHAIVVFGAGNCIDSMDVVIEAALTTSTTAVGTQLAEAIGSTLRSMVIDAWMFERDFPEWRRHFAASLRELIAAGVQSEAVYYNHYYMELEDAGARLLTLQRGLELFPDSQNIRQALVGEYVLRRMREEAIEQYLILMAGRADWDGSRESAGERIDERIYLQRNDPDLFGVER